MVSRLGAEIIPFVKFWVVVPCAFVFLLTYSFLANHLSRRQLFFSTIVPFLLWVPFFSLLMYPNLEVLAPTSLSEAFASILPERLQFVSGLVYYWPLSLLYVIAELWGAAVICSLFWSMVNDVNNQCSAASSYPVIVLVGNTTSIFSSPLLVYCVMYYSTRGEYDWQASLSLISVLFLLAGVLILLLFESCYRHPYTRTLEASRYTARNTHVTHLPLVASVRYLAKSPQLQCIALLMLSYCAAANTLDVAWKSLLITLYPTEAEYSIFMSVQSFCIGTGCLIFGFLVPVLLQKSWQTAALATPVIMAVSAIPFFLLTIFNTSHILLFEGVAINLIACGAVAGFFSNAISKSAKYTLFDVSKELAFIPLDSEEKYKGKAAIELIVSRLGKSGSSFIQQFMIAILGSLAAAMPWLLGMFLIILLCWFFSIRKLSRCM